MWGWCAMAGSRQTSLHAWHAARGARFVDFAGWDMPVQYPTGILEEHRAVRTAAGLFDVSHMGEFLVEGAGAQAWLNAQVTNDVGRLVPGRAVYTPLVREDGGTIDDLIIYQLAPERFLLCVNASNTAVDFATFEARRGAFGGRLEDVSAQWSLLALQGPRAAAILAKAGGEAALGLPAFGVVATPVAGVSAVVARTGYTGEDGFELFLPWDAAATVADALLAASGGTLKPCGLGARDSLRTEAGYPLYGHELSHEITPLHAGLGWTVKLDKGVDFVGRAALAELKRTGVPRRVAWFRTGDRRIVRPGTPVLSGGEVVGTVLSGTLSAALGESIGSALVDAARLAAKAPLLCDVRGASLALQTVKPPFIPLPSTP